MGRFIDGPECLHCNGRGRVPITDFKKYGALKTGMSGHKKSTPLTFDIQCGACGGRGCEVIEDPTKAFSKPVSGRRR